MVPGLSRFDENHGTEMRVYINYTGLINATCKRRASANGHVFTELEHKPNPRRVPRSIPLVRIPLRESPAASANAS